MAAGRVVDDYLTPTRSQYWRDAAPYRAPAFAGSRVQHAPAARDSTPVSSYRTSASGYGTRSYTSNPTYTTSTTRAYAAYDSPSSHREASRPIGGGYDAYRDDDYSTPPRRTVAAVPDSSTSAWRPVDAGSDGRGRDVSPRGSPGYNYLPVQRMDVPAAANATNLAPPRPHLQRAGDAPSALGRWTASGSYASPGRTRDDSPVAVRARSPQGSSLTATHFPSAAASPPRASSPTYRGATGGLKRSPSMVKDPCSAFLPAAHPNASHRLCLALDLDETLVFARNGPVHVRPFAKELLRELHDMDVEVIVWTAGERDYAQSVIKMLDPHGTIQHCVYRHHKWWSGKPGYSKNLRALGRNLSRTLLVDNTPDCLRDQPDHGLLVSDFEGARTATYDQCLRDLVHVVAEIVARPHDPVPRIMADSRYVTRRTVPMDAGGTITTWTLANDRVLEEVSYQVQRYNRDSPQRVRGSFGRW
uniref:Mitochondrial import inner membrane translocase subunit TIM50 n=1 Tax=Neobodo designis TaxID=312471 RepID=A0A7S1MFE2_NEODS|mmetsp:Transcript_39417/g.121907  ORF Transcript_39417/g.121907 Transcript_39417/m.121907 type:complete len:473 (+) Transcript_39417:92-1510(+)